MKSFIFLLLSFVPVALLAQQSTGGVVSGRVVNTNDDPVPFANVVVKGNTSIGVTADSAGHFEFNHHQKIPFSLIISSVGYIEREVRVKNIEVQNLLVQLQSQYVVDTIVITSRRRREVLQDVPIPISVIGRNLLNDAGAFNVNRAKELVPSVQLYTSNPRNTGINIRGLGSPFGLTNDGLDPGVGYYVDGVYFARPAAATLDFIDIDQIEVLRGPQGTLFGKNTTSGAFNITTRKPSFHPGANFEISYGNYNYVQARTSITGPLTKKLAARVSFSGTQRNGVIENIRTNKSTNTINNLGLKAQLLYKASENVSLTLSADNTRQRPDGYAQVVAGVVKTQRPAYRQFDAIIADLNYKLPSLNAFDRKIDHDTPWNSDNDIGGASLNVEAKLGPGTLTSTTAWRYWDWGPSNDRDFTGLQALALSQNPTKHKNWSQEVRYAGNFTSRLSGVVGLFYIYQDVKTTGSEVSGRDQWRFSQSSTSPLWKTDSLFEGYGAFTNSSIKSTSAAAFANIDWEALHGLHIQPGIRFNYDKKDVVYDRQARGGKTFTDPALLALRKTVYSDQSYATDADEDNFTYNITVSYRPNRKLNGYATFSTSFKPVGVNVSGLPTVDDKPALDLAVIKPEYVKHYEAGLKSTPFDNFSLNVTFYNTDIKDYQANVQSPQLGVNRGYLANAEKVRVRGAELDANYKARRFFTFYGALAYTDGKYVKFKNAPLPLEETGTTNEDGVQVAFKDISGGKLPGISKWAGSLGSEFARPAAFLNKVGSFFVALDGYFRSSFSSSPSPSKYLNINGYVLANGRLGFRSNNGFSAFIWGRNLFDKNYHELLLPAGGNAGHYASVLGDPRTYGVTLRYGF
ncbi:MAG: TonB-dependent receptor [Niabella sp.]